jgi:hypothetical protein
MGAVTLNFVVKCALFFLATSICRAEHLHRMECRLNGSGAFRPNLSSVTLVPGHLRRGLLIPKQ